MLAIFELMISAGLLGIIIAVMEDGDFPGWWNMIGCLLAAIIPSAVLAAFLPESLHILASLIGAGCVVLAISALCGMSVKRAAIAAGIYFVCRVILGLVF